MLRTRPPIVGIVNEARLVCGPSARELTCRVGEIGLQRRLHRQDLGLIALWILHFRTHLLGPASHYVPNNLQPSETRCCRFVCTMKQVDHAATALPAP